MAEDLVESQTTDLLTEFVSENHYWESVARAREYMASAKARFDFVGKGKLHYIDGHRSVELSAPTVERSERRAAICAEINRRIPLRASGEGEWVEPGGTP
jgi:hypothetical protein